ncbi:hypothetical protein ACWIID_02320 [Streptomyces phaeochromogenes]
MASAQARRNAAKIRDLVRAHRTARAEALTATRAARRVATGARSLATHVLATGANRETVKGIVKALRTAAKKAGVKGRRARIRRSFENVRKQIKTVFRYTREQVAQIAAKYAPRKDEYKVVRAALLAA